MKGRILLIDDNMLDLKIASSVLEREGYSCHSFTDAQEGVNWAHSNSPQIIFLDLQMPKVSGYELIPIFKSFASTAQTPLIIMSGKNQAEDVKKAIAAGANDYLIKPLDALTLQEKIRKIDLKGLKDEFGSVLVPEKLLESTYFIRKIKILSLSEFGFQGQSDKPVETGEIIEMRGLPLDQFGSDGLIARCLSVSENSDTKEFIMQFTFVGLTESQRQIIRKFCRQLWIQIKGVST